LESKEEEDAPEEAFNTGAFAQLVCCPGWWQAGPVLVSFGIPRDDSDGSQGGVDPGDEAQAPIGGVQADHARTPVIETHCDVQQRACKGRVMDIGW
jgi:hypothetical protein